MTRELVAYVGETRSKKLRDRLSSSGIGVLVIRGRLGKAAIGEWPRWTWDNGAYVDWKAGKRFDFPAFEADIMHMLDMPEPNRPDFAVLPDVVAGGVESLRLSMSWLYRMGRLRIRWALAVQDGMRPEHVPWDAPFDTVFVGGTLEWKLETSEEWVKAGHENGKSVHIGRVGTKERVSWAKRIGADSVDSSFPLWSKKNASKFEDGLLGAYQDAWEWGRPAARSMPERREKRDTNSQQLSMFPEKT